MNDPVDGASARAQQLAEFSVLLDLLTERLHDLQQDFVALQDEMVKAHALLATLPAAQEQPAGDIWGDGTGDQTST